MKISNLLKDKKQTISFEVFPPKPNVDTANTFNAVKEISSLRPDFISVTYGAGGSNSKNTVDIASFVQNECNTTALAHLTCIGASRLDIDQKLLELQKNGIKNVLALRGDIPNDQNFKPCGDFAHASELVEYVKQKGDFCIGGACYPEGHIESANMDADLDNVKKKVEAGCDFLTTQMFFDNSAFYSFLHGLSARGVAIPVIAGIMPITSGKQIKKSCALSGATLPVRFKRIVDKYGDNPESMKQAGIVYACEQIVDLLANGVAGVHVYTMNKPEVASAIYRNIKSLIGK